jgi:DNA-binding transcriptional regulator YdaS (Cro superfamily)
MTNSTMLWTTLALVAAAVLIVVSAIASRRRSRVRTAELRQQFGPEYDRAVQELGNRARAEHELTLRTRCIKHLQFRELNEAERTRFASSWTRIQGQFVDDPGAAVWAANELIQDVMHARGYPSNDFDHRIADLSVDRSAVVPHYRAAKALSESNRDGQVNTEELRQAVVHYRVLFGDLLQESSSPARTLREVRA